LCRVAALMPLQRSRDWLKVQPRLKEINHHTGVPSAAGWVYNRLP
jgi:hypothetical protein